MNPRRVLIVDDEPSMRLLARMSLRDECCEVVGEAGDGFAAIDLAAELHPDLIVLDELMPGLSGTEALPVLRRLCPDAEIILWTVDPASVAAAAAHSARVVDKDVDALVAAACAAAAA